MERKREYNPTKIEKSRISWGESEKITLLKQKKMKLVGEKARIQSNKNRKRWN